MCPVAVTYSSPPHPGSHTGAKEASIGCHACLGQRSAGAAPHTPLLPFPVTELHSKLQSSEAEVRSKREELSSLQGQLKEARAENSQLTERIQSIEALLEAGQARSAQVSPSTGSGESSASALALPLPQEPFVSFAG